MNKNHSTRKLTSVIPVRAREEVNNAPRKEGIAFDINNVTPQSLEELIEQQRELTVDVDNEHTKVRVFCE
jgi:hypothetical protein